MPTIQPVSYLWDFGDGTTSAEVSPSHVFTNDSIYSEAIYTVSLTITYDDDSVVTNTYNIVVYKKTLVVESYAWDFGDGGSSAEATPSHTFINSSTTQESYKEVSLTVGFDGGESVTNTHPVILYPDRQLVEVNTWDFDDGEGSALSAPTHSYDNPDLYTVSRNVYGFGISADASLSIKILPSQSNLCPIGKSYKSFTTLWDLLWFGYAGNRVTVSGSRLFIDWSNTTGNEEALVLPKMDDVAFSRECYVRVVYEGIKLQGDGITSGPNWKHIGIGLFGGNNGSVLGESTVDVGAMICATQGIPNKIVCRGYLLSGFPTTVLASATVQHAIDAIFEMWIVSTGVANTYNVTVKSTIMRVDGVVLYNEYTGVYNNYVMSANSRRIGLIGQHGASADEAYIASLYCVGTGTKFDGVCAGTVQANFAATPTVLQLGETIDFTDDSLWATSPATFAWDFNGELSSTEKNPQNIAFPTYGFKTVSLTVTTSDGADTETKTDYVTVKYFNFTGSPLTGAAPISVSFLPEIFQGSATPVTYLWDFGDGEFSTDSSPTHTYSTTGIFTVTLEVTLSNDEVITLTKSNYMTVKYLNITDRDLFDRSQPSRMDSIFNIIEAPYFVPEQIGTTEIYKSNTVTLAPGESKTMLYDYSKKPAILVSALADLDESTVSSSYTLTNSFYAVSGVTVVQNTDLVGALVFKLVVSGDPIEYKKAYVTATDAESVRLNGPLKYTMKDNELIQTESVALLIANKLLSSYKTQRKDVYLEYVGNPAIELGDTVNCPEYRKDSTLVTSDFSIYKIETSIGNSLTQKLTGRKT